MIRLGIDWRENVVGKVTGISRYLNGFCRYLLRPGHEWDLRLFGNQRTAWEPFIPEKVKRVFPERRTVWWDQVTLPRQIFHEHCQLFLTPYFKAPLFCSAPVVLIVNDLIPRNFYFRMMLHSSVLRAAGIIAISNATKNDLLRFAPGAVSKTTVIPLGVGGRFSPGEVNRQTLAGKFGIQGPYLLYVGNENRHKNLPNLLQAVKAVPERELVLCGVDPKKDPSLPKIAAVEGVLNRVHFFPSVSEEDLLSIYRGADIFVFPSLAEGFGLPPLEAMACGVPVVSSSIPATREVMGDAAFFVNAKKTDEIARGVRAVIEQPLLRDSLVRKGKDRVTFYSEYEMASSMAEFLKSVLQKRIKV